MRTGLAPCSHKKRRMNCICTVSSERCVEDGAATLQPKESTSHVSVLCLQSAVRQATCREHGCRRATRKMHAICICIISSERCAPPPSVSVLCLQSVVPQATCRGQGCRLATRRTHVSVLCLQSVVPQATCRGRGCRRATSAPTGPTSRTRGRRCASNAPTRRTQSSEPRPP